MTPRTIRSLATGCVSLAALLLLVPLLWTQEPPANPDTDAPPPGVDVLARGPIHEAYAEPAHGKLTASPIVAKQPPDPIEEIPPDQKPDAANVQWLPGYWAFDEERSDYIWVSGFWRVPPPGRTWMPGGWNSVEGGWQWVPGFWALQQQEVTYLPPPPEPLEAAPSVPAPTAEHVYVSGYWVYRDSRYVWRPGYWYLPRRGWVWVPAHYTWTPAGYVFVDGYWDYTLRDRGLLFAPIYVDVTVCRRPGWYYRPSYVIADDCLVTALFVRPGHCHYYFGDYYEPCHRRAGFVAFYEGRGCHHDPLFAYYRYEYRDNPRWEVSIRATYAGRYNGEIARPPRTLIQQNTVVQNITVNNTTINNVTVNKNVNNVQNVAMVSSLKQVQNKGVALKPVAAEEREVHRAAAKQVVQASQQRTQLESQVRAQGGAPTKPTDAPRVLKMDLPRAPTVAAPSGAAKTPTPTAPAAGVKAPTPTAPATGHPTAKGEPPAKPAAPKTVAPPPTGSAAKPPLPPPPSKPTGAVAQPPRPTSPVVQPHIGPSAGKKATPPAPPLRPAPPDTKKADAKKDKDKDKDRR